MIERYKTLIASALIIQQKRHEIKQLLKVVSDNITANEMQNRNFDRDAAKDAVFSLSGDNILVISKAQYVDGKANYEDIEINLHCTPDRNNGWKIMEAIMEKVTASDMLKGN